MDPPVALTWVVFVFRDRHAANRCSRAWPSAFVASPPLLDAATAAWRAGTARCPDLRARCECTTSLGLPRTVGIEVMCVARDVCSAGHVERQDRGVCATVLRRADADLAERLAHGRELGPAQRAVAHHRLSWIFAVVTARPNEVSGNARHLVAVLTVAAGHRRRGGATRADPDFRIVRSERRQRP